MKQEKSLLVRDKKIFYRIRKSKRAEKIKVAVYITLGGGGSINGSFFYGCKIGRELPGK